MFVQTADTQRNDKARKWLSFDNKLDGAVVKFKDWVSNVAEGAVITFSHSPNGYKVTIQLKNKCITSERERYFNQSLLTLLDNENIGPDEIIVQFEGASIQAQVAKVDKNLCNEYYAMFQVPQQGSYRSRNSLNNFCLS